MPRKPFGQPVPVHRPHGSGGPSLQDKGQDRLTAPLGPLVGVVRVPVGEEDDVLIDIDPEEGPRVHRLDGGMDPMALPTHIEPYCWTMPLKKWTTMTNTEQETVVRLAAKKNYNMVDSWGNRFWQPPPPELEAPAPPPRPTSTLDESAREKEDRRKKEEQEEFVRKEERCKKEMAKKPVLFYPVSVELLSKFNSFRSPGLIYGLEFPWTAEGLEEFGPKWLTQAFHTAGTMEPDNEVTKIIIEDKIKVTAGNNGAKFLFEVEYLKPRFGLHTKLFAKVPYPFSGPTKTDRLSCSIHKQGMDLTEINAYRLLETSFPTKTPKYYYGDISNETTNYILITERVPFSELGGKWKGRALRPLEIEGPYDKCKDFQLRSAAKEYYTLLFQMSGRLAGLCKSGKMGSPSLIAASFMNPRADVANQSAWGINPLGASGEDPHNVKKKLQSALEFMQLAKRVFPGYVNDEKFCDKFTATLMKASAYKNEIDHWKHKDSDYVSLGHQNLNTDNAYFWRDANGKLDCGLLDWGGLGLSCLGHKLWWVVNCADFDQVHVNLPTYIEAFVTAYKESGGPQLDPRVLEMQMLLTALDNTLLMVAAVPNCHKMCPLSHWATIRDRHDKRISENIDGKSTLRTTLHVLSHGCRIIQEMGGDTVLDKWIKDCWVREYKAAAKTDAMINGE